MRAGRATGSRTPSISAVPGAELPARRSPAAPAGAGPRPATAEGRPGLGHSLDRTRVFPPPAGAAARSVPVAAATPAPRPPAARAAPGPRPIQALFSRDDLARYWRTAKSYLNPFNTFGRNTRAASHYGEATSDIAGEVDRSLRVVSPARLLLGKISPWHRNRPDEVTRSDRDEINRLIQDVHVQGSDRDGESSSRGRRVTKSRPTGINIDPGSFASDEQARARRETSLDLVRIARTRSGRELLRSLHSGARGLTRLGVEIMPQPGSEDYDPNAGQAQPKDNELLGRNQPTGSVTSYVPTGLRVQQDGQASDPRNPWVDPARGDVSLYHELVHAHHQQRGGTRDTYAADALPAITRPERRHRVDRGVPREEYRTVGLSHRYRGDRFNENRYRRELQELGEDVALRTTYNTIEPEEDAEETARASTSTGETSRLLDSDEDD